MPSVDHGPVNFKHTSSSSLVDVEVKESPGTISLKFTLIFYHKGCPVGNILAIPITGMLAKYGFDGGWPSVFYCFGK